MRAPRRSPNRHTLQAGPRKSPPRRARDEPAVQDEEFILDIPPASDVEAAPDAPGGTPPAAATAPAPALAPGSRAWEALAEEIRMQVLQRIDLFTDTGLREQLGARLQPIVDRASAELVATINQHVGELLRALRRRGDRARDREVAAATR